MAVEGSDGSSGATGADEVSRVLTRTEVKVLRVEPIVRELNRNLTALLGRCPISSDGRWVTVRESRNGAWCAVFPELPVHEALRLSSALARIDETLGLGEVAKNLPQPKRYQPAVFLGSEPVRRPSSVHVEVPR